MGKILNFDFNFEPAQSPIITGSSYVVPVGFFGFVNLYFLSGRTDANQDTISINGTVVLRTSYQIGGNTINGSQHPNTNTTYNNMMPNKLVFWANAGTSITGTGTNWRASITLFKSNKSISGFNPFNYEPDQLVVASANYTIPVGKFARVIHYHDQNARGGNQTLTINGVQCSLIKYPEYIAGDGSYENKGTNTTRIANIRGTDCDNFKEYFLKAGDIVGGSGSWRAIIMLYNIQSWGLMFIVLIFGLIVGNLTQMTLKFDYCKKQNFDGDYCKLEKNLNEKNRKWKM